MISSAVNQFVESVGDYIEFMVTDTSMHEAQSRNKVFFEKYGNLGTHRTNVDKQRMTGYLAEIAIKSTFPHLDYSKDDRVDFWFRNKISFDSKSQGCNVLPMTDYAATLYEEQKKREVDFYIFSRVKNDFSKVWILGIISKKQYLEKSKLMPAGTKTNNFTYNNSRFELPIKDLYKPSILFAGCKK